MEIFENETWYTVYEAAKKLDVVTHTVYNLGKHNELEMKKFLGARKDGKMQDLYYFSKKSVIRYLKTHKWHTQRKNDQKTIEGEEIDRICHELLDGCWVWMSDHIDYMLKYGCEVVFRTPAETRDAMNNVVPDTENCYRFYGMANSCTDEKLQEIKQERREYYESGVD